MDRRREVPRTDAMLADPRLVSTVAALGRTTVKGAGVVLHTNLGRVEHGRPPPDLGCVPPDRDGDVYAAVREA